MTRAHNAVADAAAEVLAAVLAEQLPGLDHATALQIARTQTTALLHDGWLITALPPCRCATRPNTESNRNRT